MMNQMNQPGMGGERSTNRAINRLMNGIVGRLGLAIKDGKRKMTRLKKMTPIWIHSEIPHLRLDFFPICVTLHRFFTPLLELWCRESAEDQESGTVY